MTRLDDDHRRDHQRGTYEGDSIPHPIASIAAFVIALAIFPNAIGLAAAVAAVLVINAL